MAKKICSERRSEDLSSSSSAAAEEVAGNDDLLSEILQDLPVKSLIRFRLVSKQWASLISDPHFDRNHTRRRDPNSFIPSGLFFYNSLTKSQEIESVSLDGPADHPSRVRVPSLSFLETVGAAAGATIKILQSCNGLLLCRFTSTSEGPEVKIYCVCNPTTKKYTIIPQPDLRESELILDCNLAFDPSVSPHYKVVCVKSLRRCSYPHPCQIDIYSSESVSWRPLSCPFTASPPPYTRFDSGVYWNGSVHWIGEHFSHHFDVNAENLIRMQMPRKPQGGFGDEKTRYFGEWRGHLHFIQIRSLSAKRFNVLEMDRDTSMWFVKYRVHICWIIKAFPEIVQKADGRETKYAFSILAVVRGEQENDSALVLAIPGKVISHNLMNKTSKVLRELPGQLVEPLRFNCVSAYQYIETLSSV